MTYLQYELNNVLQYEELDEEVKKSIEKYLEKRVKQIKEKLK